MSEISGCHRRPIGFKFVPSAIERFERLGQAAKDFTAEITHHLEHNRSYSGILIRELWRGTGSLGDPCMRKDKHVRIALPIETSLLPRSGVSFAPAELDFTKIRAFTSIA